MANGDPIRVGLVGCGAMGRSLAGELVQVESARLVGVADASPEASGRAAAELVVPGFDGIETLIENTDAQAVLIAAPPFLHRAMTEYAAAAGRHVFVEKPMAVTSADCDAMIAACGQAGVTLMVGQVLRYYPTWSRVIELVAGGAVGKPIGISVTRIGPGYGAWLQPWRNSAALSGGILMEVNAHEIDFMCCLGGDVARVYAEADHYGEDPGDYPNLCFVSLRFASGAVGLLHSSQVSALGDLSGQITGSEGALMYRDGFAPNGEIRWARRGEETQTLRVGGLEPENAVRKELRLFVEAVRNGTPPPVTGAEGRRNVRIAEAAYESARTAQPVSV